MNKPLYTAFVLLWALSPAAFSQEEFYHPELEWRTIETPHFYVNYHEGEERTARVVAKVAEDVYGPVTSLYKHEPDTKVSFIIKDYDDYSNGAAYFYDNKVEIWASALDFDLRGTHNWLRNVVTHEFTHIIQMQTAMKFSRRVPAFYLQWLGYESERRTDVLYGYPNIIVSYPVSGFNVPSWFAEGVAQYNRPELAYDYWDSHRDMILRMYALDDRMLTWNEMSVFGKTSLGNESSYNAGFAFVHYLGQKYGDEKLREISENLSSLTTFTIDGAIEKALGKPGGEIYDEWRRELRSSYRERTEPIRGNVVSGKTIASVGFGNFYPEFSPDGRTIAYISNKESDYFYLSSVYLYDLSTGKEKLLKDLVRSSVSFSPDGRKIYYSKLSRKNPHWSNVFDIYVYDIAREDETRLTHGLRGYAPAVSPDGRTIAFAREGDGTVNLFLMDSSGTNVRPLTHYTDGEQVYGPKFSPDGGRIIYDYSIRDGRDIAVIPSGGGEPAFLIATADDERNPVFTPDGNAVVYASDRSGIFNLYRYDLSTKESSQITNVLGGAFMPAVNPGGEIAYSYYTSTGYKINLIGEEKAPEGSPVYALSSGRGHDTPVTPRSGGERASQDDFPWQALRSYDDTKLSGDTSTAYRSIASSLEIVPLIRVDNYNPRNKGIDVIKPGVYLFSYDVLERYGFFGGGAINLKGERDLFFTFDYRGKIPGLFSLGLEPALSFEAYNLSRVTTSAVELPEDTIGVDVTYNLLELDAVLRQKVFDERLDLEMRYAHSRYTASVSSFLVPATPNHDPILVPAYSVGYLIGNDLSFTLKYDGVARSRTGEINPVGRKLSLRYDYEFSKFNPHDTVSGGGEIVHIYETPAFSRLEGRWRESVRLPFWSHTLTAGLAGGKIFGAAVNDFFDFYLGGLAGMKGYPFYSLGGNQYIHGNLTYRFPLLDHIDVRVGQIYFDKLYAAVYADVGNAWTGGGMKGMKFKRDAGVELRMESFSFYSYPTRVFFNATYGLDRFDRYVRSTGAVFTYGQEWNYHFGILFDFDLD